MIDEIANTIEHVRSELEALMIRGIRAAGPEHVALLMSAGEEFERIGADHMAGRIADVVMAIDQGDPGAAAALLRAQTSLRLFDRLLTLDVAEGVLAELQERQGTPDDQPDET